MFVTYEDYEELSLFGSVTEDDYERMSPIADLIVDHWTLGRIGRASARDEELPDGVKALYGAVIEALPTALAESRGGELVKSFSNGVDSFTFELSTVSKRLEDQLGWMLDMLPVEWVSECVPYEGGPHAG